MAGTEGTGFDSASVDLFKGKPVVITPASGADSSSVALVERLWRAVGGETFRLGADEHDQAIALTSHLPYAIAVGLARMAADETEQAPALSDLMAGSFRSATRVAASSPDLTLDMWLTNREKTAERIERLSDRLKGLAEMIRRGDQDRLRGEVQAARTFVMQIQKG
jgi:prephenate dehydrogenase